MRTISILFWLALLGCAGDTSNTVGAAGGTVSSGGAQVVIPPGALAQDTAIAVAQTSDGAPALPDGVTAFGPIFAFTPHGTSFAVPVTINVPFDPASVPAGTAPVLYKTNATMTAWSPVPGARVDGGKMIGEVTGFSFVGVANDPGLVTKTWEVHADYRIGHVVSFFDRQTGGVLDMPLRVGAPYPFVPDGVDRETPNAEVVSDATGRSLSTLAVAPHYGVPDPRDPDPMLFDQAGGTLGETFTFRATQDHPPPIIVVVTGSHFEAIDDGGNSPGPEVCPWLPKDASAETVRKECNPYMSGAANIFELRAQSQGVEFFAMDGIVEIAGLHDDWRHSVSGGVAEHQVWTDDDFVTNEDETGSRFTIDLKAPITIAVPVADLHKGDVFNVSVTLTSSAGNEIQGESFISTSLQASLEGSGMDLKFEGLELIPAQDDVPPTVTSVACASAPDPAAGVLQLGAADFEAIEGSGEALVVVERVGGTKGLVSGVVTTSDGTAVAGSDYQPVQSIVRFADGEAGTRLVRVPLVVDAVAEPDKTVNVRLSDPGGCASLGQGTSATLTILDDDRPIPVTQTYTVGGTVSGLVGTGLALSDADSGGSVTPANGPFTFPVARADGSAYDVRIDAQPQNPIQVCTVANGTGRIAGADVTNIEVTCTTPAETPGLDPTFGSGGKLTGVGADAEALALQPDGKLLAVGGMTLSRFNADGSADLSFGTAGKVTIVANGGPDTGIQAIALQADGKIVVAGQTSTPPSPFNDMVVLRYLPDGSPDTGFGTGGKVVNDLSPSATAVLVQGDGKIVVAGAISRKLAAVRYLPDGSPDTGFGSGGQATSNISGPFGPAAALQADGAIVLAGSADDGFGSVSGFWVTRFRPDGGVDLGFGDHGTFHLDDAGEASDVAIQPDGKIVVGGSAGIGGVMGYALMRLTTGGSKDQGFGTQGVVRTVFTGKNDFGRGVALQADGRIVLVGLVDGSGEPAGDFGIARYLADGSPDTSFGSGGLLQVDFFGDFDRANDVVVQPDGKLVVGGSWKGGLFSGGLGVVRVLP